MDNYYETCLQEINALIQLGNVEGAMEKLNVELSMPYVPQPYLDIFNTLKADLRPNKELGARYFESIEEIEDALHGNDTLKHKALISLQRMNLRSELEALIVLLQRDTIDDWLKKQILFFMMEQDMDARFDIALNNQVFEIDIKQLENPIGSEAYLTCLLKLRDMLEANNPSLLALCNDELDIRVLEYFPNHYDEIDPKDVLKTVETYMNATF